MRNIKLLGALSLLSMPSLYLERAMQRPAKNLDFGYYTPRGKAKPKQGASNPLRGYYARYSNVLTPSMPEINHRNAMNKNKLKRERRAAR